MRYVVIVLLSLLAACGGSSHKDVVENPYSDRMRELTRTGVDAMQRERWQVAESLFERALQAAQLANDQELIGQAWYNLGVLHISSGEEEKGESELMRAASVAQRHQQEVTLVRARVALALLHQKSGRKAWQPDALGSSMPMDLHLSVARLAQLQQRYDVARREYEYVVSRSGKDRATLLYKIDAHMGMALLHLELNEEAAVHDEIEDVLKMSRDVGAPRQAAHALLLSARLVSDEALQTGNLQNALAIYEALDDKRGQKDVLNALIVISTAQGDETLTKSLNQKLQSLNGTSAEIEESEH